MPLANRAQSHRLKGKRILVVEDHDLLGSIILEFLKHYDHASHARSGKEALDEIQRQPPSAILLDISLPDISGLEVVRLIRKNKNTKSIPILAMSASREEEDQCLRAGCNGFILKPFDCQQLLNQLNALLAP